MKAATLVEYDAARVLGEYARLQRPEAGVLGGLDKAQQQRTPHSPARVCGRYVDADRPNTAVTGTRRNWAEGGPAEHLTILVTGDQSWRPGTRRREVLPGRGERLEGRVAAVDARLVDACRGCPILRLQGPEDDPIFRGAQSRPRLLLAGLLVLRRTLDLGDLVVLAAFSAHANGCLLLLGLDDRELDLALCLRVGVHHDGGAGSQLLAQHEIGEWVLDVALDRTAQRARAHRGIPALVDKQILGGLRQLQLQLALGHRLADAQQQQLDDLLDLLLLQLVEDDLVVYAVEELGSEDFLQLAHDAVLHVVVGDARLIV